jgi:hypothetical protein
MFLFIFMFGDDAISLKKLTDIILRTTQNIHNFISLFDSFAILFLSRDNLEPNF